MVPVSLETVVGRARVRCFGRPDKAKTTAIASYGADFQRGRGVQKQRNRVRSVATHKVRVVVDKKLSIHAVLPVVQSGQLPFLGLALRAWIVVRKNGLDCVFCVRKCNYFVENYVSVVGLRVSPDASFRGAPKPLRRTHQWHAGVATGAENHRALNRRGYPLGRCARPRPLTGV
jgi:hypothetical protein